jgi:predicted ester cyclase
MYNHYIPSGAKNIGHTGRLILSRFDIPSEEFLRAREKLVLDHFQDEVAQDWDATLSTFPHPHYELIAQMLVHDGDTEVRQYYYDTRVAFPDQRHEIIALRHSDDAVIVEFWLLGTHLGPLGKIPPTGGTHRTRMTAYFIFDDEENLVTERIYFDQLTVLKQLFSGLDKKNPKDLLTLLRALGGALALSGAESDPRLTDTVEPNLSN